MHFIPTCHPRQGAVGRLTVLVACLFVFLIVGTATLYPVAAAPVSKAAHASVLVPDRKLASQMAPEMQARMQNRAQQLPAFLHGENRTPQLLQNGFLTRPVRQARLAKAAGEMPIAQVCAGGRLEYGRARAHMETRR